MQAVAMFREMYRRERTGRIPGGVCYFPGSGRKYFYGRDDVASKRKSIPLMCFPAIYPNVSAGPSVMPAPG
jgi:hypothetical protein